MNAHASALGAIADLSLRRVLTVLNPHDEKALVITYGGRTIQAGYHITEVRPARS